MSIYRKEKRIQKMITGYRPVVRARQGLMLGICQPLDGPCYSLIFVTEQLHTAA